MKIKINDLLIECKEEELISDVLLKNGFVISMPCGGKGKCRKCTIEAVNNGKTIFLPACKTKVCANMEIKIKESPIHNEETGDIARGVYAVVVFLLKWI